MVTWEELELNPETAIPQFVKGGALFKSSVKWWFVKIHDGGLMVIEEVTNG